MTTQVGGISASFTGDSSGLTKAVNDAVTKLDAVRQKSADLNAALRDTATTSKLSADGLTALKSAAERAESEVLQLTGAQKAQAASAVTGSANAAAGMGKARESIEKARGMMGALGQMTGTATTQMGALGGVVGNALGAFMSGGAIGIGIALVSSGIAIAADKFDVFGAKAAEASAKAAEALRSVESATADVRYEIEAMASGRDLAVIKQEGEVEKAKGAAQVAVDAAPGGARGIEVTQQLRDKGMKNPLAGAEAGYEAFLTASRFLAAQQNNLSALIEKADLGKELAAQSRAVDEANKAEAELTAANKAGAKARLALNEKLAEETDAEQVAAVKDALSGINGVSPLSGFNPQIAAEAALALVGLSSAADAEAESLAAVNEALTMAADETGRVTDAHAALEDQLFSSAIVITDLDDPLSVLGEKVREIGDGLVVAASSLGDWVAGLDASDVASGIETAAKSGFQGVGGAIGAQIGGAIDVAFGGATGGLGTVIGGLIGGILGKALDSLINALGILTPLFDAIAVVIGALQPVLSVVGELFLAVANVILALAPLILLLSRATGAYLLVFVRLIEAFLPFLNIVLLMYPALFGFLDLLVLGVSFLDTHFFRPLVEAALWVQNGFIDFLNGITKFIRLIPGLDKFGTLIAHVNTELADTTGGFAGTPMSGLDVTGGGSGLTMDGLLPGGAGGTEPGSSTGGTGSDAADNYGRQLTNVPSGYKGNEAEFSAAAAEGPDRPSSGRGGALDAIEGARSWTINIAQWNSRVGADTDVGNLRRLSKQGLHVPGSSFSRFNNPDDRN